MKNSTLYGYGKYDTQILIQARRNLENVYSANYRSSSRDTALLETIISKLDRLLKEYGAADEVDAYFGKADTDNKNQKSQNHNLLPDAMILNM